MAGDKNDVIDLRGARLLKDPKERQVFMPPSVVEVRRVRAANLMNATPELARAWGEAVSGMVSGFDNGLDAVEGLVPRGGASVLALLGFYVEFVGQEGEADRVKVCLTDPYMARGAMG